MHMGEGWWTHMYTQKQRLSYVTHINAGAVTQKHVRKRRQKALITYTDADTHSRVHTDAHAHSHKHKKHVNYQFSAVSPEQYLDNNKYQFHAKKR